MTHLQLLILSMEVIAIAGFIIGLWQESKNYRAMNRLYGKPMAFFQMLVGPVISLCLVFLVTRMGSLVASIAILVTTFIAIIVARLDWKGSKKRRSYHVGLIELALDITLSIFVILWILIHFGIL